MFRKLAYAAVVVGLAGAATFIGCGSDTTTSSIKDFSSNTDGGTGDDLAGDMNVNDKSYVAATPNQVDTNTIGGNFSKGTAVSMTGLIVLGPVTGFKAKVKVTGDGCRFEVWAQDPSCTTPPCGIVLETAAILNPGGSGAYCDYTYAASTVLAKVEDGDKVNIQGVVDTFSSSGAANDLSPNGTVVQHEIDLDTLTTTDTKQPLPAPMVVTDTNPSLFVPYSGTGWAMYESTLVQLKPASGVFTTTLDSFGGWTCAPGGAQFADTYTGLFRPDGAAANTWPPTGSTFTSISGIVDLTFGGGILPITNADFAGFIPPP